MQPIAHIKLQVLVDCFSTTDMIKSFTAVRFLSISKGYLIKWILLKLNCIVRKTPLNWKTTESVRCQKGISDYKRLVYCYNRVISPKCTLINESNCWLTNPWAHAHDVHSLIEQNPSYEVCFPFAEKKPRIIVHIATMILKITIIIIN